MVIASLICKNISVFSIFETEKFFLLKRKDFFSESNAKFPEKQLYLQLFSKRYPTVNDSNAFISHNCKRMKKRDIDISYSANIPYVQ